MSFWDFVRGPASVRLLLDFGQERGLRESELLARSRLSAAQLDDPNAELSALQEIRVVENLLRLSGGPPGLGLEVGMRYHFSTFGLWGYGLVCSATLEDAVARALRFIALTYAYSMIEYRVDGGSCSFCLHPPELEGAVSRFLVERDLAAAAMLLRDLGGPGFALSSLEVVATRGRAGRLPPAVTQVLGTHVRRDADGYRLSFPSSWLAWRLPNANPISAAMCDELCAKLVERRRARAGTATLVRQVLTARAGDGRPSLGNLAGLTSTSERTLRRRLQSEGTSFRSIVAATRAEEAAKLVGDRSLSITSIAERLGYADLSTFSQAFKRWHGVSPMAFRRTAPDAIRSARPTA